MKIKLFIIGICISAFVFKSCKKDDSIDSNTKEPTPFVFPTTASFPPLSIPVDNPLTNEGVELGRMLFYDPIMSLDNTIACASCHAQNKGFTDGFKVSKGIRGQILTRNSMPLFNLMWHKRFFWDGRVTSLREQVLLPIQAHNEMDINLYDLVLKLEVNPEYNKRFEKAFPGKKLTPELISKALEQFLITIVSFDAPIDRLRGRTDTLNVINESALRGLHLFFSPVENGGADCFHCHSNIPFFGNISILGSMANNGLDRIFADKGFGNVTGFDTDNGRFKIPSLRNVELTAPYMHDGRFDNLEEVLDHYSTGIKLDSPNLDPNIQVHSNQLNLSTQEKEDIIEFLKTLTDNTFVTNPAYASPF